MKNRNLSLTNIFQKRKPSQETASNAPRQTSQLMKLFEDELIKLYREEEQ